MDISSTQKYLMAYDQYIKTKWPVPFTFKIKKGNQWLYYFGANHTYDPSDQQFEMLKKLWNEFLTDSFENSKIALMEGGVRKINTFEKKAILEDGEAGLLSYLANKEGVKIDSPEPSRKDETGNLESEFSKEEIEYYYFARVVDQWNRHDIRPDFEKYVNDFLEMDKEESGWKGFDFSLVNMKHIHTKLFKEKFNEQDKDFFYSIVNPTTESTSINRYSRAIGIFRDAYVAKKVIDNINSGKSVFIVYGFTHAIMQEPVYQKLLK